MLLDLAGKPLLQHSWERACQSSARSVVIATDDERIVSVAESFGATVMMTATDHQSGSDRIAECAQRAGWADSDLIVNLQGDEPLMPPACLDQVAELLASQSECEIASLYWPITDAADVSNPNAVKVVVDQNGRAMYFSRSPIPFARDYSHFSTAMSAGIEWKRHLGIYAYRLEGLRQFTASPPSPLEMAERLEQLRMMEQGVSIAMARACEFIPAGVDTLEDLERVRLLLT
jgi:3-deoxy-manno-octulosonate cytidylyltransferase (CMP-KDO synthetase)